MYTYTLDAVPPEEKYAFSYFEKHVTKPDSHFCLKIFWNFNILTLWSYFIDWKILVFNTFTWCRQYVEKCEYILIWMLNSQLKNEVNYSIKNYRGLSPNYRGKRWAYIHHIRGSGSVNHPIILHYPITNYRCCTGGPLSIMGDNSPCIFPIMLRVNMTRDLACLQLSDLQGEIKPTCRTSDLQGERIFIRRM